MSTRQWSRAPCLLDNGVERHVYYICTVFFNELTLCVGIISSKTDSRQDIAGQKLISWN